MNKLVIYQSHTGFTEKYAKWIAEDLNCTSIALEKVDTANIKNYDVIIFGGGMHAGKINGIKFIKDNLDLFNGKRLIVYATGGTPYIPGEVEKFKQNNIPSGKDIAFFYFQSGMNYERMALGNKIAMKLFNTFLKAKRNKSDIEKGTSDAINKSYDYSSREKIKPLINFVEAI